MRATRLLAATTAASLLAVGPLAAGVAAATDDPPVKGVGTGTVAATLLGVDVGPGGDLLSVRVLADDSTATIDPTKGTPSAAATLRPLTITSRTVPGLNLTTPPVATSSQGAEDKRSVQPEIPTNPAFSGALNAVLSSVVDPAGARSGLQAGLANLKVAGGLVSLPTGAVQLATDAAEGKATGARSITIPEVRVLDLSAVLEGLGLRLSDLPLDDVLGLLDGLGIALPGLGDPTQLIDDLNAAIDLLQAQTGPLTAQLCAAVDGLLGPVVDTIDDLLGGLPLAPRDIVGQLPIIGESPLLPGLPVPLAPILDNTLGGLLGSAALLDGLSCTALTQTAEQLLDDVQGTLGGLLGGVLARLGETSLLSVKDIELGLVATATETVESSLAQVTATIGDVQVGNLAVPAASDLDLAGPTALLDQASAAVQTAIGDVLSVLDASLGDLVDVELLSIDELVGADGDYAAANAAVTAVKATLTPPTTFGAALLDLGDPVSGLLGQLGTAVPPLSPLMTQLEATLGGLDLLQAPAVVTVGQLAGTAAFQPVTEPVTGESSVPPGDSPTPGTPVGTLPRTGTDAAVPALLAAGLAGAALAIRRLLRHATSAA